MQHDAAFHQGLHCLLKIKQSSETKVYHKLENSNCDSIKITMGSPILIVSNCMGKSMRIHRIKLKVVIHHYLSKIFKNKQKVKI